MCELRVRGADLEEVNSKYFERQMKSMSTKFDFCSRPIEIILVDRSQVSD